MVVFGIDISQMLTGLQDFVGPLCVLFGPTIALERRLMANLQAAQVKAGE